MSSPALEPASDPTETLGAVLPPAAALEDEAALQQIRALPREMGVMLVAVGALGWVLPGMLGTPALIAGGLVLWPKAFGRVETWFERRYPKLHHESMRQLSRYLSDLDRRYPESTQPRGSDGP